MGDSVSCEEKQFSRRIEKWKKYIMDMDITIIFEAVKIVRTHNQSIG